jgi:hypothetical protein
MLFGLLGLWLRLRRGRRERNNPLRSLKQSVQQKLFHVRIIDVAAATPLRNLVCRLAICNAVQRANLLIPNPAPKAIRNHDRNQSNNKISTLRLELQPQG